MRNPDDPTASTDSSAPNRDQGKGPGEEGERSFYGRWSRRKRQAREGGVPPEDELVPGSVRSEVDSGDLPQLVPESSGADDTPAADEPVLTDADMPPLESLGDDDDYSGFMSPGVSEGLRNQALRKLFMSSQFNVLDGLNDYDDDFRSFEALGDIITSDMRHQIELEAERAKREAEEKAKAMLADDAGEEPLEVTRDDEHSEQEHRGEEFQEPEPLADAAALDSGDDDSPEGVNDEDSQESRNV